jgi:hypothetical protein
VRYGCLIRRSHARRRRRLSHQAFRLLEERKEWLSAGLPGLLLPANAFAAKVYPLRAAAPAAAGGLDEAVRSVASVNDRPTTAAAAVAQGGGGGGGGGLGAAGPPGLGAAAAEPALRACTPVALGGGHYGGGAAGLTAAAVAESSAWRPASRRAERAR